MNLYAKLQARAAERNPLRVGLIGAGKFGSMYLAQAKHTRGIHIVAIADLSPERARTALARTGWPPERVGARSFDAALQDGTTFVTEDGVLCAAMTEATLRTNANGMVERILEDMMAPLNQKGP